MKYEAQKLQYSRNRLFPTFKVLLGTLVKWIERFVLFSSRVRNATDLCHPFPTNLVVVTTEYTPFLHGGCHEK